MSTKTSPDVTPNDIHAMFDDELASDRAELVSRALDEDPELRAELEQLGLLRGTVCAALEAEAQAMPAARFEQIWDEIDRAIDRDARLQAETDRGASVWSRLWAALRPVRIPVLAAAAAAAVTVVVVSSGDDQASDPNNSPSIASVDEDSAPAPVVPEAAPKPDPTRIALRPNPPPEPEPALTPMPIPESNEVEIHDIDFGDAGGSISSNGTVTVLYVEEDDAPPTSERSL